MVDPSQGRLELCCERSKAVQKLQLYFKFDSKNKNPNIAGVPKLWYQTVSCKYVRQVELSPQIFLNTPNLMEKDLTKLLHNEMDKMEET